MPFVAGIVVVCKKLNAPEGNSRIRRQFSMAYMKRHFSQSIQSADSLLVTPVVTSGNSKRV